MYFDGQWEGSEHKVMDKFAFQLLRKNCCWRRGDAASPSRRIDPHVEMPSETGLRAVVVGVAVCVWLFYADGRRPSPKGWGQPLVFRLCNHCRALFGGLCILGFAKLACTLFP